MAAILETTAMLVDPGNEGGWYTKMRDPGNEVGWCIKMRDPGNEVGWRTTP